MKHEHFWVMCAAASATAVVIGGAASAALAQQHGPTTTVVGRSSEDGMSVRVSYRDLNLASAHGEKVLKRRVGGAARHVCEPDGFGVSDHSFGNCVSYAWKGARPQIALAVQRAREIAVTGTSSIPLVAISIGARY